MKLNDSVTFDELLYAFDECAKGKRNTVACKQFDASLIDNIQTLCNELNSETYEIGQGICFVVTRPSTREIWAGGFRDKVVHYFIYSKLQSVFERRFVKDSCACIPGRGTLYGAKRLETHTSRATNNWRNGIYYLKCDLSNFFVSISQLLHDL